MKKIMLSLAASLAFLTAASFAQSSAQDSTQGTPNTTQQDPSMGQSSTGQSAGTTMQQGSTPSQGTEMKGEKKMKGCIRSEGGQYVLEDKHGKSTPLSGQDLSSHVGHEVTVHGMWANGSSDTSSTMSSSGAGSSAKAFSVSTVDMVSETCPMDKSKTKSPDTMQK
ncbi:MAG TPA: hypothetical protein VH437_08485 [Terriglobales bacterium]